MQPNELLYVAPKEPPPSRRPPAGTIGVVGWMRKNLFSGWLNTLATIITVMLVTWFLYETFTWVITSAQWGVVTNNVRFLNVGDYPESEIWRMEVLGVALIILGGLGTALWGGVNRAFMLTLVISVFLLVLLPLAGDQLPPAPIRFLVGEDTNFGPMRFPADEGQEITLAVEAIQTDAEAKDEANFVGLIESAQGSSNSRIRWSEIRQAITDGTQPVVYNQQIVARIYDAEGELIEELVSSADDPDVELTFEAPETGWYIARAELVEGEQYRDYRPIDGIQLPTVGTDRGFAWIRLDNVPVYYTSTAELEALQEEYGPIPLVEDCGGTEERGACQVAERNVRFVGKRSLGQYLRLEVSPYIREVALPIIAALIAFLLSFSIGYYAKYRVGGDFEKWVNRATIVGWLLIIPLSWALLNGWFGGNIDMERVQGLALTLFLTFISVIASLPLGVMLALGRRSGLPVIGTFSILMIELVRGAPLITILFFAKQIVPFFFGAEAQNIGDVLRMLIGLTVFSAAYQAEIVRGGLQIIPKGQTEAAQALGLNGFYTNLFIILPQALRAVIPPTMSQFVSLFKDTSLVSIIGLFELLGIVEQIVNGQERYRFSTREAYLYVGIIYFIIAFVMSAVSRRLEETGSGAARRR